jgi:hypothetical protein
MARAGYLEAGKVQGPKQVVPEQCCSNGDFLRAPIQIGEGRPELLSNLVFEACRSCGDLVGVCGFNSVFERDACDDFG